MQGPDTSADARLRRLHEIRPGIWLAYGRSTESRNDWVIWTALGYPAESQFLIGWKGATKQRYATWHSSKLPNSTCSYPWRRVEGTANALKHYSLGLPLYSTPADQEASPARPLSQGEVAYVRDGTAIPAAAPNKNPAPTPRKKAIDDAWEPPTSASTMRPPTPKTATEPPSDKEIETAADVIHRLKNTRGRPRGACTAVDIPATLTPAGCGRLELWFVPLVRANFNEPRTRRTYVESARLLLENFAGENTELLTDLACRTASNVPGVRGKFLPRYCLPGGNSYSYSFPAWPRSQRLCRRRLIWRPAALALAPVLGCAG